MIPRIGFIGFGPMARNHRLNLAQHPALKGKCKIVAATDPSPEGRNSATKHGFTAVEQLEDLLNLPDLDAVMVCSPPQFHASQVIAALEAGKHVYSEVPMALTKEEIERILNAEDRSKKIYQLGEDYCFISEVLYAGYLIRSGRLGDAVYAESEYLHDVSYRWYPGSSGQPGLPKVESWYSRFDPLAYGHSIGPAQVALGGLSTPEPFIEVQSYLSNKGGNNGKAISDPAAGFHVALFRGKHGSIAKCANAYEIAREPTRLTLQVVGQKGTYESYKFGSPGYLFLADDHIINKHKHREGRKIKVTKGELKKAAPSRFGGFLSPMISANTRILEDWIFAISKGATHASLHGQIGANFCMAGISASQAAHGGQPVSIPQFE